MSLRGVNLLTATTIVAEIGDLKRFASALQLMAYLGVVSSEYSSGGSKITRRYHQERQWPCAASLRHTKVKVDANPYDPSHEEYFEKRLAFKMKKGVLSQSLSGWAIITHFRSGELG